MLIIGFNISFIIGSKRLNRKENSILSKIQEDNRLFHSRDLEPFIMLLPRRISVRMWCIFLSLFLSALIAFPLTKYPTDPFPLISLLPAPILLLFMHVATDGVIVSSEGIEHCYIFRKRRKIGSIFWKDVRRIVRGTGYNEFQWGLWFVNGKARAFAPSHYSNFSKLVEVIPKVVPQEAVFMDEMSSRKSTLPFEHNRRVRT